MAPLATVAKFLCVNYTPIFHDSLEICHCVDLSCVFLCGVINELCSAWELRLVHGSCVCDPLWKMDLWVLYDIVFLRGSWTCGSGACFLLDRTCGSSMCMCILCGIKSVVEYIDL